MVEEGLQKIVTTEPWLAFLKKLVILVGSALFGLMPRTERAHPSTSEAETEKDARESRR